jgi:hypothetical protein
VAAFLAPVARRRARRSAVTGPWRRLRQAARRPDRTPRARFPARELLAGFPDRLLAKAFLAKAFLAKAFLAKAFLAKAFLAKAFLAKAFLAKAFLDRATPARWPGRARHPDTGMRILRLDPRMLDGVEAAGART